MNGWVLVWMVALWISAFTLGWQARSYVHLRELKREVDAELEELLRQEEE